MTFWIAGGALTALTTIAVLMPALWQRRKAAFNGRAQAVYSDQLQEVDRDEKNGLISPHDAEAVRVEVKRRMLAAARRANDAPQVGLSGGSWAIIASALFVAIAGVGTYLALGSPQMPSKTFASRAGERNKAQEFDRLIARLRDRLANSPAPNVEGWVMLTQTYLRLGHTSDAVWAITTLIDRGAAATRPELYGLYAEALIRSDNGVVSPKAEAAINKVLQRQPGNIAGVYYKSLALEQSGDLKRAFVMLRDRVRKESAYQPWMDAVVGQANSLAARIGAQPVVLPAAPFAAQPAPTGADVAAAGKMSSADRKAFIRSMVQRLAGRLAQYPDDLDGWIKLGRAYGVLGETAKSIDAYKAAEKRATPLAENDPRRALIANGLAQK